MDLSNVQIIQVFGYSHVVRRMPDELMVQRIINKHATPNYMERGLSLVAVLRKGETLNDLKLRMERFEAKQRLKNYKGSA